MAAPQKIGSQEESVRLIALASLIRLPSLRAGNRSNVQVSESQSFGGSGRRGRWREGLRSLQSQF